MPVLGPQQPQFGRAAAEFVELAVTLTHDQGSTITNVLALAFFAVSFFFVYRSFYGMRIRSGNAE